MARRGAACKKVAKISQKICLKKERRAELDSFLKEPAIQFNRTECMASALEK
jgi:hypothetical protein